MLWMKNDLLVFAIRTDDRGGWIDELALAFGSEEPTRQTSTGEEPTASSTSIQEKKPQ
jgi:hypothetical protein